MITSLPARYELVTGSGANTIKLNIYNNKERLDNNNIKFVKIANYLMKNIPILDNFMPDYEVDPIYIGNEIQYYHRFFYNFRNLMFIEAKNGEMTYRYDINRAYLTMLSPFLNDDKFEYFYRHKEDFVKAVGFCAYRYYIKDIITNEIIALQNAKRPDLLNFCVEALNFIKNILFEVYANELNFYYIDCAGFTLDLDKQLSDFGDVLTEILEWFYKKNGIDTKNMKKVTIKFEGEFKITYKDGIFYLNNHPFFAMNGNKLGNL